MDKLKNEIKALKKKLVEKDKTILHLTNSCDILKKEHEKHLVEWTNNVNEIEELKLENNDLIREVGVLNKRVVNLLKEKNISKQNVQRHEGSDYDPDLYIELKKKDANTNILINSRQYLENVRKKVPDSDLPIVEARKNAQYSEEEKHKRKENFHAIHIVLTKLLLPLSSLYLKQFVIETINSSNHNIQKSLPILKKLNFANNTTMQNVEEQIRKHAPGKLNTVVTGLSDIFAGFSKQLCEIIDNENKYIHDTKYQSWNFIDDCVFQSNLDIMEKISKLR